MTPIVGTPTGDESDLLEKLSRMVLADEEPALSTAQLEDCLVYARRPDSEGRGYSDTDWEPTWDLDAAAAEGWRRKASIAANRFNFAEDNQRFDRAQVYQHCAAQAEDYARRSMGAIT